MPVETISNLAREAHKNGGKLVLRGLVGNSFKETAEKLKKIPHGALIDPTLFETYEIKNVPTFVKLLNEQRHPKDKVPYRKLSGNVSVQYALNKLGEGA